MAGTRGVATLASRSDSWVGRTLTRSGLAVGTSVWVDGVGAVLEMDTPVAELPWLEAAFERSHVAVVMIAVDGRFLAANPAARRLLGNGRRIDPTLLEVIAAPNRGIAADDAPPPPQRIGARDCRVHRVDYRTSAGMPFAVLELVDVTDLRHRERQLLDRLEHDTLTGVASRDAFFAAAAAMIDERRRAFHPLSVVMIDVDDFKAVNDEAGHAAGDRVLAGLAACCRDGLREGDVIGRLGGDEFAALLPGAGPVDAQAVIERIEGKIAAAAGSRAMAGRRVTASFGTALYRDGESEIGPALERADQALYAVKAVVGGNRRRG